MGTPIPETPPITGPVAAARHLEDRFGKQRTIYSMDSLDYDTFAPFDGIYPERWPEGVTLPAGIEMLHGGTIDETTFEGGFMLSAWYLFQGDVQPELDRLYAEIEAAGFRVADEHNKDSEKLGRGLKGRNYELSEDPNQRLSIACCYYDNTSWSCWMVNRSKSDPIPLVPLSSIK